MAHVSDLMGSIDLGKLIKAQRLLNDASDIIDSVAFDYLTEQQYDKEMNDLLDSFAKCIGAVEMLMGKVVYSTLFGPKIDEDLVDDSELVTNEMIN